MKIYTRTGDNGMTSLVGGKRIKKCSLRLDCYGGVDELNSFIGLLLTYCDDSSDSNFLYELQKELFVIGGSLASDDVSVDLFVINNEMIERIESEIDRLSLLLPPLNSFIIPGGTRASAYAHVCRTVCRRVERSVFLLIDEGCDVDINVTKYLNRLSDYFFALARKLNEL